MDAEPTVTEPGESSIAMPGSDTGVSCFQLGITSEYDSTPFKY